MKILITMAGEGSRFKKIGYDCPKHEIEIRDKTLFEWSMKSLKDFYNEDFIFIVRKNCYDKEKLENICEKLGIKKFKFKEIENLSDGQASTAYLCNELILDNDEIVIYNIDTYIEEDELKKNIFDLYDGFIPVFKASGDRWSFIKINKDKKIEDVVEKRRVSNLASVGFYYFKSWKDYKEIYLKYRDMIKKEYGEVYIAPMYHFLLGNKKKIGYMELSSKKVHILGTPEDIENFKK